MLKSNVRGYNDDSGIIYKEMNGLRQFKGDKVILPTSTNVYPMYENVRNVETLLKTMNDGKNFFNKGGMSKIPQPKLLSDGGFKNKGNVIEETNEPSRLAISNQVKKLSKKERKPVKQEKVDDNKETKQIKKFISFINSLKGTPSKDNKNYFKGAVDLPPDDLI